MIKKSDKLVWGITTTILYMYTLLAVVSDVHTPRICTLLVKQENLTLGHVFTLMQVEQTQYQLHPGSVYSMVLTNS